MKITEEQIDRALIVLKNEIMTQMAPEAKSNESFASTHEALGTINVEVHELIEAIHRRNGLWILSETTDVAVASTFFIACLLAGAIEVNDQHMIEEHYKNNRSEEKVQ